MGAEHERAYDHGREVRAWRGWARSFTRANTSSEPYSSRCNDQEGAFSVVLQHTAQGGREPAQNSVYSR